MCAGKDIYIYEHICTTSDTNVYKNQYIDNNNVDFRVAVRGGRGRSKG